MSAGFRRTREPREKRESSMGSFAPARPSAARSARLISLAPVLLALAFAFPPSLSPAKDDGKVHLAVSGWAVFAGNTPVTQICQQLMQQDSELVIEPYNALRIPGGKGDDSSEFLAWAGDTSPDVTFCWWHGIRTRITQGCLCPLNEYVGYDGYYGLDPATNKPNERTGKAKLKKDPKTGEETLNQNGIIDDDEALWAEWRAYPVLNRMVGSDHGRLEEGPDGKPYEGPIVYGLPASNTVHYVIVYRRDLFLAAGFKEGEVPKTWEEFWYFCQRLTNPNKRVAGAKFQRGQRAFALQSMAWLWLEWLWSNGGNAVMQSRTNPRTEKTYWYTQEETEFLDPETSERLMQQPAKWKATFATPEALETMEFYRKLCWQPWIIHPKTNEPVDLSAQDVKNGFFMDKTTGEKVSFDRKDVIEGVVRKGVTGEDDQLEMFRKGEVAMILNSLQNLQERKVPPSNLGFFPIPAGPRGKPVVGIYRHFNALNSRLAGPERKRARDKAWTIVSSLSGTQARKLLIEGLVLQGYARFMTPQQLAEFGLNEYIDQIPQHWRDQYETIIQNPHAEPFMGYWSAAERALALNVIGFIFLDRGFDIKPALKEVERRSNSRLMFGLSEEEKTRCRPWALLGVIAGAIVMAVAGVIIVRSYSEPALPKPDAQGAAARGRGSSRNVYSVWLPWLLLAPALASITLWAYYPLLRGSVMAFQDYRLVGNSHWVGLDNFITVFTDRSFYISLMKTFKFAALSLGIGFLTPIFLAVLLTEIPKGKFFLRTVYFLPQISSGLVVLFIWKLMYNPTEYGLLNQVLNHAATMSPVLITLLKTAVLVAMLAIGWVLYKIAFGVEQGSWLSKGFFILLFLAFVGAIAYPVCSLAWKAGPLAALRSLVTWLWSRPDFKSQDWLGDARWAMVAVILPGVWAGAGMGSLIYLAALKNVDEESYEAAEIDGGGFFEKAWYITVPYLKPLLLINFVGAFIGVFRDMGNIFAMTGGGPGDETTVLSLAIWYDAFAFLRFGEATAKGWFLGLMLIAFTIYQLRILKKVEFRRAEAN